MALKLNTFEGGGDATVISIANSGGLSGNEWETVNIGAGDATAEYDDARAAQGSLSARLATTTTAAMVYFGWTFPDTAEIFTRFYLWLPSTCEPPIRLVFTETVGSLSTGRYQINAAGKLELWKEADAANLVGTKVIAMDTWVRIETRTRVGASNGLMEARLFLSPHISTPDEIITMDPANTTNTAIGRARFGWNANKAACECWYDSIAIDTAGYIGPHPVDGSSFPTRRSIVA